MYPQRKEFFIHVLEATIGGARGIQSAGLGLRVFVLPKKSRPVTCSSSMEQTDSQAKYIFIHGGGQQAMLVWDSPFIYGQAAFTILTNSAVGRFVSVYICKLH
jgi:hypothetical protein